MVQSIAGLMLLMGGAWVFDYLTCAAMDKWL